MKKKYKVELELTSWVAINVEVDEDDEFDEDDLNEQAESLAIEEVKSLASEIKSSVMIRHLWTSLGTPRKEWEPGVASFDIGTDDIPVTGVEEIQ